MAHRPHNHELWMELGRLHERRGEVDEAWMCYDHVQNLRQHISPRDDFLNRLTSKMDGRGQKQCSCIGILHVLLRQRILSRIM